MTTSNDQIITTADVIAYEDGKPLDIVEYAAVKPAGVAKGERSAEYIVDNFVPLSDLTEEEIERLVDYKAELKKRDAEYTETMDALNKAQQDIVNIHAEAAANAKTALDALIAKAYEGGTA